MRCAETREVRVLTFLKTNFQSTPLWNTHKTQRTVRAHHLYMSMNSPFFRVFPLVLLGGFVMQNQRQFGHGTAKVIPSSGKKTASLARNYAPILHPCMESYTQSYTRKCQPAKDFSVSGVGNVGFFKKTFFGRETAVYSSTIYQVNPFAGKSWRMFPFVRKACFREMHRLLVAGNP